MLGLEKHESRELARTGATHEDVIESPQPARRLR